MSQTEQGFWVRSRTRCADPLYAADPRLLSGARLCDALSLGDYAEVPFQPLTKPLAECHVALITTAAPYQPGRGDQGPGAPYNVAAKFYNVYSGDSSIDHDLRDRQ